MEIILPEDHILFTSANNMRELSTPLRNYFNINHFSYVKINSDLSRVHLDTNIEWNQYFNKNFYSYCLHSGLTESKHWASGYSLLHLLEEKKCITDAAQFNIGNGVVISSHSGGVTELAFFALSCSADNVGLTRLINNLDMLYSFIAYFKDVASAMILDAEKTPIQIPFLTSQQAPNRFSLDERTRQEFLRIITRKPINFTIREIECIQYLAQDMSMKNIAKVLDISPRTVEKHISNAKSKVECKKSSALVKIFKEMEQKSKGVIQ